MAEEAVINVTVQGTGAGKKTVAEVRQELKETQKEADKTGESLDSAIGGAETKAVSLKTQLKLMKAELLGLDENSDRFKKLSADAANLEDRIGDVSARVKALASDTKKIDTLVGVGTGIAGAFQAASGAMALFGSNSEAVQKAIQNVIAVQGILNGVQTVANVLNRTSIVGIQLRIVAEKLGILTTDKATASQLKFNAAMLLNPVFLVIAGVLALVAGVVLLIKYYDKLIAAFLFFAGIWDTQAIEEAKEEQKKQERRKAEGAAHQERLKQINKERDARIKAADQTISALQLEKETLEANGKSSTAVTIKILEAELEKTKAVLDANNEKMQSWITYYTNLAQLSGKSTEDFKAEMKARGIDLDLLQEKANELIKANEDSVQRSENAITQFKREQGEKAAANEAENQKEIEAKRKALYDAEMKRLHDLQAQRISALDAITAAESAYQDSLLTNQEREANAVRDKYFSLIESADQFGIDSAILKEAQEAELFAIEEKYLQQSVDLRKEKEQEVKDFLDALKLKEQEDREKLVNATIQSAQNLVSIVESINTIANNKEIERIKKKQQAGEQLTASEIRRLKNQEKVEKAFALAQVAIDTAKGIAGAVASGANQPYPYNLFAIVSGIAAVLAGVAQATTILGTSSSVSAPTTESAVADATEVQDLNTGNLDAINSGSTLLNQEPNKVYVVESDITNTQNAVNAIVSQNTWG